MSAAPVIIGAGAAGLTAALCLAPRPVTLLCAGRLTEGAASRLAQGGIAAAIGADDSPALHAADTLAAGAGLCDAAAVRRIIDAGPWAIAFLQKLGAEFAASGGELQLGLEAAHRRRRIVHAADATGSEVMRVLVRAVRQAPHVTVIENARATRIELRDGAVQGVAAVMRGGPLHLPAAAVILATGGIGGLFSQTTNPLTAWGSGLVLAAAAGAVLRDLEFVQFHPTAFACGLDPMPLLSEALRGEGAVLVNSRGERFLGGGDLATRDVVARGVAAELARGETVFLDARAIPAAEFPNIFAACRAQGIDPARQPIPVAPAAHYHMGGVAVDAGCESSVSGLFAIGEVASTGLHGANRLASNSLLEALVTARLAATACLDRAGPAGPARPDMPPPPPSPLPPPGIRDVISRHLGIRRDADGLKAAMAQLEPQVQRHGAALLGWLMAQAALHRRESRGAHFRTDFTESSLEFARSSASQGSECPMMSLAA